MSKGTILSIHSNHEFTADDTNCTVVTYAGKHDGIIFATQVSARRAKETFGEAGVTAIKEEISSLLKKKVFTAALKSSLSTSQRKKIIRMSSFVRDKTDAEGTLIKVAYLMNFVASISSIRAAAASCSHSTAEINLQPRTCNR